MAPGAVTVEAFQKKPAFFGLFFGKDGLVVTLCVVPTSKWIEDRLSVSWITDSTWCIWVYNSYRRWYMQRRMEMKKAICLLLVIALVLFAGTLPGYAAGSGGHGGGHGGSHGGSRGGSHGGGHGGGHGHGSFSGSVWIGPGWGGWGPWWGFSAYPYYYPYYYPYNYYPYYYGETPVAAEERPSAYVEPAPRQEEEEYWYFCPDSKNYYPYVKKCPGGWLRVVPPQTPPDWRE